MCTVNMPELHLYLVATGLPCVPFFKAGLIEVHISHITLTAQSAMHWDRICVCALHKNMYSTCIYCLLAHLCTFAQGVITRGTHTTQYTGSANKWLLRSIHYILWMHNEYMHAATVPQPSLPHCGKGGIGRVLQAHMYLKRPFPGWFAFIYALAVDAQ